MHPNDLFVWDTTYSIGIPQIDAEHQELIGILNDLHVAIRNKQGSRSCREVLNRLADYTHRHFSHEEDLMVQSGYPELDAHRKQHEGFLRQAKDLDAKLTERRVAIAFELLHMLRSWLAQHIQGSDRRFGEYRLRTAPVVQRGAALGTNIHIAR